MRKLQLIIGLLTLMGSPTIFSINLGAQETTDDTEAESEAVIAEPDNEIIIDESRKDGGIEEISPEPEEGD